MKIKFKSSSWLFRLVAVAPLLFALLPTRVQATIPAAALADPRYGLGYLVVTNYSGVDNTGATDSTVGLQNAINDAYAANASFSGGSHPNRGLVVFFPPGTYTISNTLQCFQWWTSNNAVAGYHMIAGSTEGTSRPLIKLATTAPNFNTATSPRSMIVFVAWQQQVGGPNPPVAVSNPMAAPSGYKVEAGDNMGAELRDINFDCNGHAGAMGVTMSGAQYCIVENVLVRATNAFAGFYELPGASGCSANLEVDGGQYGILQGADQTVHSPPGLSLDGGTAGPVVAGLTLANQTVASVMDGEFLSPMTIAGFNITNSQQILLGYYDGGTSEGILTLLDGQININSATNPSAIYNVGTVNGSGTYGRDLYLRNVYVSGTTQLVTSGTSSTTGSGTWSHITEYAYNCTYKVANVPPNSNYAHECFFINSYSLINGTTGDYTVPLPVSNVTVNSGAPPANLVSEHLWASYPSYNGAASDPATLVMATNIGWNGGIADCTTLVQSNIDLASTNVSPNYHGRVFVPSGIYSTSSTLTLHTNTVLMGASWLNSRIFASQSWKPSQNVSVLQTDNNAAATTILAHLDVCTRTIVNSSDTNYSWFNAINWQAGANSVVLGVRPFDPYTQWSLCQARSIILVTNNGGGRWYSVAPGYFGNDYGSGNNNFHHGAILGTSQALWFYGYDHEGDEGGGSDIQTVITGASNVRFLGLKRESSPVSLQITDSTNIAGYSFGFDFDSDARGNGYFQILGKSTNILLANLAPYVGDSGTHNIVYEAITGLSSVSVLWPNFVSLYKRGTITDMYATNGGGGSPPPTPTGLMASQDATLPSEQIDLSWNSVAGVTGYNVKNSTVTGGPYTTFASPPSGTLTADNTSLTPGTAYYYVVSAVNGSGESPNSAEVTQSTRTNAVPSFTKGSDQTVNAGAGPQTVNGWATSLSAGANESWQTLNFLVSNNNNSLFSVQPAIDASGNLTYTPVSTLANNTTAVVTVQIHDNGGTAGGGVDTSAAQTFNLTVNTNLGNYAIVQTATAPVIDGLVDAIWSSANTAAITNVSFGSISGPSDCSGNFQTLWDTTNLYVLVQVTDDIAVHDSGTSLGFYDDSVEIYIDAGNTKTTNYQANDFHYGFYFEGGVGEVVELAHNATTGVVAKYLTNSGNANYVVEVKIPWSTVGQTNLTGGALLGLDVQIDDNDHPGVHLRDADLQWHDSTDQDFQNPSHFGTVKLESITADVAMVQTPTAPTIDGIVDAIWSTAYTTAITNVSLGSISGPSDCSGTYQTLWDANNLYVLVQVTDDIAVHDSGTSIGFYDDSVELYIDAGNTKATNYGANDFHYGFYFEGGVGEVVELAHNATTGVVAKYLTNSLNANYVVEAKIPWSTVGISVPGVDTLLGFDAQIDDNDHPGVHLRDADLQWHDSADQDFQNPSHFGTARLAPSP